ncbi:hypothetical protein Vi05172_g12489 [Venturia inaequalis]|nr:hypothetical protein Vi05172_g12489 [Venturia inaequalis]
MLLLTISSVNAADTPKGDTPKKDTPKGDTTICTQITGPEGHCNVYNSKGEYILKRRTQCRKVRLLPQTTTACLYQTARKFTEIMVNCWNQANPCKVEGNGCWLKFEYISGGWYSNCS